MTRAHGVPPENLLWRARIVAGGRVRELQCTFEQLGEDCFELRVSFGAGALVSETFANTQDLLFKADELRMALAPGPARRGGAHAGSVRPTTRH